jgi:hypothetical protein
VRRASPVRLSVPVAVTALALLAAGCGGAPGSRVAQLGSTTAGATRNGPAAATSPGPAQRRAALAFSRCMRANGAPGFPDPDGQGSFPPLTQQALGVSKQTSLAAQHVCEHLLSGGGGAATPQQRQQKVAFGLKVAGCLRTHGFPGFPDPSGSSQALPTGIDPTSPRFQAAETGCEKQAQHALGLP